jgi:hypothetical protein
MTTSSRHGKFETLKREVLALGLVRPGSLVRRFMPCGNSACRCMGQPPQLHGPYHQWTHKIAGKTKTVRLSAQQARLCREWSSNHKKLKRLLQQMEQLSLKETDRILVGARSRP